MIDNFMTILSSQSIPAYNKLIFEVFDRTITALNNSYLSALVEKLIFVQRVNHLCVILKSISIR